MRKPKAERRNYEWSKEEYYKAQLDTKTERRIRYALHETKEELRQDEWIITRKPRVKNRVIMKPDDLI